ncbi:MAG TPA: hypothetical protein VFZ66_29660 [Herpetosiphonaceae bacterium]
MFLIVVFIVGVLIGSRLRVGSKSVLFGVHCWAIHPWFVALAWWKLYGFPFDPRLWVAFLVHDLGYFGKPNMDGIEGQTHPELGGRIMARLFGQEWGDFTRLHSRYYARIEGKPVSKLCAADKLATSLTPAWIYVPLGTLTGEIDEYMALPGSVEAMRTGEHDGTRRGWFRWIQSHFVLAAQGTAKLDPPLQSHK